MLALLAVSVQVDLWALVGAIATMALGIAWLVGLWWRQKSHEDVCGQRYAAIETSQIVMTKIQDQRHSENRERLNGIDERIGNVDKKMDLVIARLR
jgi:hypothetical protein